MLVGQTVVLRGSGALQHIDAMGECGCQRLSHLHRGRFPLSGTEVAPSCQPAAAPVFRGGVLHPLRVGAAAQRPAFGTVKIGRFDMVCFQKGQVFLPCAAQMDKRLAVVSAVSRLVGSLPQLPCARQGKGESLVYREQQLVERWLVAHAFQHAGYLVVEQFQVVVLRLGKGAHLVDGLLQAGVQRRCDGVVCHHGLRPLERGTDAVGDGLLTGVEQTAEGEVGKLRLCPKPAEGKNGLAVVARLEHREMVRPVGRLVQTLDGISLGNAVAGETDALVAAAIAPAVGREIIGLSRNDVNPLAQRTGLVGCHVGPRLQIWSSQRPANRRCREIGLAEVLPAPVLPVGGPQGEIAICEEVAAHVHHFSRHVDGIAGFHLIGHGRQLGAVEMVALIVYKVYAVGVAVVGVVVLIGV